MLLMEEQVIAFGVQIRETGRKTARLGSSLPKPHVHHLV
jgi:hypothetical protein